MSRTHRIDKYHHRSTANCPNSCTLCQGKRTYKNIKREWAAIEQQKEYEDATR